MASPNMLKLRASYPKPSFRFIAVGGPHVVNKPYSRRDKIRALGGKATYKKLYGNP